jgi:hypothetical protein
LSGTLPRCSSDYVAINTDVDAERGAHKGEVKPEWIRPKQVKELFGLGTNLIQQLIREKRVKTVIICPPGSASGTRLLSFSGLCAFLEGLAAEQMQDGNTREEGGAA